MIEGFAAGKLEIYPVAGRTRRRLRQCDRRVEYRFRVLKPATIMQSPAKTD